MPIPQDIVEALSSEWRVVDGGVVTIRRAHRAFRVIVTLLIAPALVYAVPTFLLLGAMAWSMPCLSAAMIVIVEVMIAWLAVAELLGDFRRFELRPDAFVLVSPSVLGPSRIRLTRGEMVCAYAEAQLEGSSGTTALVVGCRGDRGLFRIQSLREEHREPFAAMLRGYYGLPEYPPSSLTPDANIRCLKCHYNMTGNVKASRFDCPECGEPLRQWQIDDWHAAQDALRSHAP